MQSNIAFIIKELKNDQFSSQTIQTATDFISKQPLDNICVFTSSCDMIDSGIVPVLHISHAAYFDATIIALDFESLLFSSTFIQKQKVVYYARGTPWSEKVYKYQELKKLFTQESVNRIISANEQIAKYYNKFFGQKEYVSHNLTYGDLYEKIQ